MLNLLTAPCLLDDQLTRADELLPRPLAENCVNVAVVLDVVHWRAGSHE